MQWHLFSVTTEERVTILAIPYKLQLYYREGILEGSWGLDKPANLFCVKTARSCTLIRGSFLPLSHYSSKKTMLGLWTCLQSQHQSLAVVQVFWECPCSPSLLAINESAADDLLLSLTHTTCLCRAHTFVTARVATWLTKTQHGVHQSALR